MLQLLQQFLFMVQSHHSLVFESRPDIVVTLLCYCFWFASGYVADSCFVLWYGCIFSFGWGEVELYNFCGFDLHLLMLQLLLELFVQLFKVGQLLHLALAPHLLTVYLLWLYLIWLWFGQYFHGAFRTLSTEGQIFPLFEILDISLFVYLSALLFFISLYLLQQIGMHKPWHRLMFECIVGRRWTIGVWFFGLLE